MYPFLKSKAVIIIGLLGIIAGGALIIGLMLNLQIRFITPQHLYIKLSAALFLAVSGAILLFIQFQIKKQERVAIKINAEKMPLEPLNLLEKLRNCDGNYQSLIEQSFDAIYLVDFDGNFIDVNSSMCRMTGYSREELLKLNVSALIDPEQSKTDPFTPFNYRYDEAMIRERRFINKNGKLLEVEINVKKIVDDRLLVVAKDITRKKQLETELHKAELKFRTLAEKSSIGVYVVQKEKLIYINRRFAEVFGYDEYELVNLPNSYVDVIISQDFRALLRKNLQARYSGEIDFISFEVTGIKKDGSLNHIEFSGGRAVIEGEPTIIGTMIDITERWHAEEVLKQYEANLQTILDTADIAYALFDKNLKATAFNEMASEFSAIQYAHALKIGDDLGDYFPAEKLPKFTNAVNEVLEGNNTSYEINYPQADGSVTWYLVRLVPITNNHQEIFGLLLALSNITERKIAENNLHAAYQRIQTHINSIKEMAWKQSHLVRSPLANLKGLVMLLQDDPSDQETLKNIGIELDRLDKVIIEMAEDASGHDDL
jgi:PAS domain S-box-containing protein